MKAIQIVVDADLLERVDRSARALGASRSATVRRLLELGLEQEGLARLAEEEARAYARKPLSPHERSAYRALSRSQKRVLDELSGSDRW
jgi:metal-responsive CopG/Arc/MetJ family transcriptional regulator